MKKILLRSFRSFQKHSAPRFAAAIAYYMIFCLAPLFVFMLSALGIFLNDPVTNREFFAALQQLFGREAVLFLQENLEPQSKEVSIWITIVGLFFALLGASAVFKELKCGLDTLFEVKVPKGNFLTVMMRNLTAFSTVIVIGLFLIVSLLSTMAISIVATTFSAELAFINTGLVETLNFLLSLIVLSAFFMILHSLVPDAKTPFRLTLVGGVVTALLFTLGKTLFGMYLGTIGVSSAYGAAGSILVLLLWIFYSAQIFFFGAAITAEIKKDKKLLKKIIE